MRDPFDIAKFDPPPMPPVFRATRRSAEPVNPRAAFEAFERGDHGSTARACRLDSSARANTFAEMAQELGGVAYASAHANFAQQFGRVFTTKTSEPDDGEGDTPDIRAAIVLSVALSLRIPFEGATAGQRIAAALTLKGVRFNNAALFPSFPENLCQPARWVTSPEPDDILTVTQSRSAK